METQHRNISYFPKDNHHSSMEKETLKGHAVSKTGSTNCNMILKMWLLLKWELCIPGQDFYE